MFSLLLRGGVTCSCCGADPALSFVTSFRHTYVLNLPSVPIRMLVLSIQLPSRRLTSSHSTATLNRHEIPYSCLVGGLGRICSHSHGNRRSAATENYDYAIVQLGASHVPFRLARSIIDLLAPQPPSMQLSSDNKGPTSPSRFRSTPKFEWLDRTLSGIFLTHGRTAFHISI